MRPKKKRKKQPHISNSLVRARHYVWVGRYVPGSIIHSPDCDHDRTAIWRRRRRETETSGPCDSTATMSFDQLSSLEAGQRRGGASYTDDPDFQRLSQDMMNKLFKLSGNNQRLSSEIGHLGTRRDTLRVRERVHELLDESREIFKEVGEGVKKIQTWDDVTVSRRGHVARLRRDLAWKRRAD